MAKRILHGPLDGLYKAVYDDEAAELTIRYGTARNEYAEDECDSLLRVAEFAQDPVEDLAEFFDDEFSGYGYRVAQSFLSHSVALAKLVYADVT